MGWMPARAAHSRSHASELGVSHPLLEVERATQRTHKAYARDIDTNESFCSSNCNNQVLLQLLDSAQQAKKAIEGAMHAQFRMYAPDYAAKEWQDWKRDNHEVRVLR